MPGAISYLFRSGVKLAVPVKDRERFIGFLIKNGIDAEIKESKTEKNEENGEIYAVLPFRTVKNIASALDKSGIKVYIIYIYGIRGLVYACGKRYGLLAGALLFSLLLWLSTMFVWRVDVSGTESISKEQIRTELASMGVSPGAKLSDIDRGAVSDGFLALHPEISWVSLGINGTTVCLTLRETESPDDDTGSPARLLVADEDAVIKELLVYEGRPTVAPGSIVRKGEVLVTGYVSGCGPQYTDSPLLRMTYARGTVTGEVERTVTETVPYLEVRETEAHGKVTARLFSVFGHRFGTKSTEGDLIPGSERYLTVFGLIELPITVREYYSKDVCVRETSRTPDEARAEAERRVCSHIAETDALTFLKITFSEDENGCSATAVYRIEKNIAIPYYGIRSE